MPKYSFKGENGGYESGYESEGGSFYKPKKELGKGASARARKFESNTGKTKAVLDPINLGFIDFFEAETKFNFYKALYPQHFPQLIKKSGTYRLIAPVINGVPYDALKIGAKREQIKLFISTIKALKDAHRKGYFIIDLKGDNIFYDSTSGKSYLIDGGMAAKKGDFLHPQFQCASITRVERARKKCWHYAPEVFSLNRMKAVESMDIFPLGVLMRRVLEKPDSMLNNIINLCMNQDPARRPDLDTLENRLNALLIISDTVNRISAVTIEFDKQTTLKNVAMHKDHLLQMINNLVVSSELGSAYDTLGMTRHDIDMELAFRSKKNEIKQFAHERATKINERAIQDIALASSDIKNVAVNFSDKKSVEDIQRYKDILLNRLNSISGKAREAHAKLGVTFPEKSIDQHLMAKHQEIERLFQQQLNKFTAAEKTLVTVAKEIREVAVSFSGKKTPQDIQKHSTFLHNQLNIISDKAHEAHAMLGITFPAKCIVDAINAKTLTIETEKEKRSTRIQEIEQQLKPISEALGALETSLDSLEYYHSKKGKEKGRQLFEDLKKHKEIYSNKLFSTSTKHNDIALDQFKKNCAKDIDEAKPILENELGWGDYLTNLAKELFNIPIKVVTLGYCGSFFKPIQSKLFEEVANVAKAIQVATAC